MSSGPTAATGASMAAASVMPAALPSGHPPSKPLRGGGRPESTVGSPADNGRERTCSGRRTGNTSALRRGWAAVRRSTRAAHAVDRGGGGGGSGPRGGGGGG